MTGEASSLLLRAGAGGPYSSEAVALFARFTTPPTEPRKILINNLIGSLIVAGVWTRLDVLDVFAAADSQAALLNWVSTSFNPTLVSAPAFVADRGFTGNGTTGYINSNFNPVTAAGQFSRDSAHMGAWSRTDSVAAVTDIGMRTSATQNQSLVQIRTTSDVASYRLNVAATPATTGTVTNSSGHFVVRRSSASLSAIFRNAVSVSSLTDASDALASLSFYIGALNGNGTAATFSTRQYAAAHFGSKLTSQNITDLYNALNTYMTAVGAA